MNSYGCKLTTESDICSIEKKLALPSVVKPKTGNILLLATFIVNGIGIDSVDSIVIFNVFVS